MDFFLWLETSSFPSFVRESGSIWAFPMFLFSHTLGMSLVAGGNTIIAFALLGLWPKGPIKPLEKLYPIMWAGFWLNLFTGLSLFAADASTRGINPDFYIKMALVIGGVVLMTRVRKNIFNNPMLDREPIAGAKALAWGTLICWFGAIVSGRLIAYVGPVAGI